MSLHGASIDRIYNGFDTRCCEILIGACQALQPARKRAGLWAIAALVGYFALVFCVPWSVPGSLGICLAALLLIDAVRAPGASGTVVWLLTRRPLVLVGVISYGAYLWHWPIHYALFNLHATGPVIAAIGLLASLGLAYLTRIWVEIPVLSWRSAISRHAQIRGGRIAFALSFASLVAGLIVFYGGFLTTPPY